MFAFDKNKTRLALISCLMAFFCSASSYAQIPASGSSASVAPVTAPAPAPIASQASASPVKFPSSSMSAATAAQIQSINENMTLLQAQLNELELKAKIAIKQREINAPATGSGASGSTSGLVPSSFASKNGNPSVISVAGLKGNVEAVLIFPGGVTQRVKAGDVIDDRRVTKIGVNEVILTDLKGKNIQRLAFGSTATVRETALAQGSAMQTPLPLPPGMPAAMGR